MRHDLTEDGKRTRFQPGHHRPGPGRPKRLLSDAYAEQLSEPLTPAERAALKLGPGSVVADGIARSLTRKALRGDRESSKELREATEGKSDTRYTAPSGQQFRIEVVYDQLSEEEIKHQASPHPLPPADHLLSKQTDTEVIPHVINEIEDTPED